MSMIVLCGSTEIKKSFQGYGPIQCTTFAYPWVGLQVTGEYNGIYDPTAFNIHLGEVLPQGQ